MDVFTIWWMLLVTLVIFVIVFRFLGTSTDGAVIASTVRHAEAIDALDEQMGSMADSEIQILERLIVLEGQVEKLVTKNNYGNIMK